MTETSKIEKELANKVNEVAQEETKQESTKSVEVNNTPMSTVNPIVISSKEIKAKPKKETKEPQSNEEAIQKSTKVRKKMEEEDIMESTFTPLEQEIVKAMKEVEQQKKDCNLS